MASKSVKRGSTIETVIDLGDIRQLRRDSNDWLAMLSIEMRRAMPFWKAMLRDFQVAAEQSVKAFMAIQPVVRSQIVSAAITNKRIIDQALGTSTQGMYRQILRDFELAQGSSRKLTRTGSGELLRIGAQIQLDWSSTLALPGPGLRLGGMLELASMHSEHSHGSPLAVITRGALKPTEGRSDESTDLISLLGPALDERLGSALESMEQRLDARARAREEAFFERLQSHLGPSGIADLFATTLEQRGLVIMSRDHMELRHAIQDGVLEDAPRPGWSVDHSADFVFRQEPDNIFKCCGDYWKVRFRGGEPVMVQDRRGMKMIRDLLAQPGKLLPAVDLIVGEYGHAPEAIEALNACLRDGDGRMSQHDQAMLLQRLQTASSANLGPTQEAIDWLRERHHELVGRRDRAIHEGNMDGAARLDAEIGKLEDHAVEYFSVKKGKWQEDPERKKQRQLVSAGIRRSIGAIKAHHRPLATYLMQRLKLGALSMYLDNSITWAT